MNQTERRILELEHRRVAADTLPVITHEQMEAMSPIEKVGAFKRLIRGEVDIEADPSLLEPPDMPPPEVVERWSRAELAAAYRQWLQGSGLDFDAWHGRGR
jgi:hypothetical protein